MNLELELQELIRKYEEMNSDFWALIKNQSDDLAKNKFKTNYIDFKNNFKKVKKQIEKLDSKYYTDIPWEYSSFETKYIINENLIIVTEKKIFIHLNHYDKVIK